MNASLRVRLWGVAAAAILTACSGELPMSPEEPEATYTDQLPPCCGTPPEYLTHDPRILDSPEAGTIILVQVVELERQEGDGLGLYAKMLVLKYWKGPFSAGEVLHTLKGYVACDGNRSSCAQYDFQLGDRGKEFLIMSSAQQKRPDPNEISVGRYWTWPAEESQALMAALDQSVADSMPTDKAGYAARLQKEEAAIKDVTTKLQVAASNHAPEAEIADLRTQLRGHRENASRFRIARDYLDKHPERSGESADRLVWESRQGTTATATH